MSTREAQHRVAQRLGVTGGALGVLAGVVQATVGGHLPAWSGNKLDPARLGVLTIALALLAIVAAARQREPDLRVGPRAACSLVILVPALLCFSTVGRLWYLPGLLLLLAAVRTIDSFSSTARLIARNWLRCLLAALGAAELLMAAGASPPVLVVGAIGGTALIAAASLATSRLALAGLTTLGSVPFASVAWTAVLPFVLLLAAAGIVVALIRQPTGQRAPGTAPSRAALQLGAT